MKTFFASLIVALVAFFESSLKAQITSNGVPWTHETDTKLISSFDTNSDSLTDAIIVDKPSGTFIVGTVNFQNGVDWHGPYPLGITNIETMTVGRFISNTDYSIAVTNKDFNNVQFAPVDGSDLPDVLNLAKPEPTALATLPRTNRTSAVVAGFRNPVGSIKPPLTAAMPGLFFSLWRTDDIGANPRQGHTMHTNHEDAPVIAMITDGAEPNQNTARIQFFRADEFSGGLVAEINGLPSDSHYLHGFFSADSVTFSFHFQSTTIVSWSPTGHQLKTARLANVDWANNVALGQLTILPVGNFNLSRTIRDVYYLYAVGSPRLLIVWGDQAGGASIFDFDGTHAPVLVEDLELDGMTLDGIVPLLNSGDFLAVGDKDGQLSYSHFSNNGNPSHYTSRARGAMPGLAPASSFYSNIISFRGEPFVDTSAAALKRARIKDWTVTGTYGGSGMANITALTDNGLVSGLGNLLDAPLSLPPLTTHLLTNQISAPTSIALLSAKTASQATLPDVAFSPPPGHYPALPSRGKFKVSVIVKGGAPTGNISVDGGSWMTQSSVDLTGDSTVRAFASSFTYANGPIRTGVYTFGTEAPVSAQPNTDANHNGLSDAWEQLTGITNPTGDDDGDGFLNIQEHNFGSDPKNAADHPPVGVRTPNLGLGQPAAGSPTKSLRWSADDAAVILEGSDDLLEWAPIVQGIRSEGGENVFDMPIGVVPRAFYRLRR